jgi:hypothetical protein
MEIFVDADACPVKEEVYRVARRYGLKVRIVANAFIALPADPLIERVFVGPGPDKADDWIADHAGTGDVVITADIPLAQRALAAGAAAISPTGRAFTANSIGAAMASRAIAEHIRSTGGLTGGPAPFRPADRSLFLQALDEAIQRGRRRGR